MTHAPPFPRPVGPPGEEAAPIAGRSPEAAAAVAHLDEAMFRWLARAMKGEMMGAILAELGLDLELAQFRALGTLARIGRAGEAATVGRLAEEMNLDPSRASRLAAELIAKGYAAREAAQDDGRKTVLTLTPKAKADLGPFRERKRAKLAALFSDWPDEDLVTFARLFDRYAEGVARVSRREG